MQTSIAHQGCSNRVEMQLVIGDVSLSIAQMGPDFLYIDEPTDHPPGEATIVFQVEGYSEERWQVRLPDGITAGRERVAIEKA